MSKPSLYMASLRETVQKLESIRRDKDSPKDITLAEMVQAKWGITMESFYDDLGVDPSAASVSNIMALPDDNMRWLVPEIYRDALRLGLRRAPIYPNLISTEQTVSQLTVTMPAINMSDAGMSKVGIGETITTGSVSFDQKSVKIHKLGRGLTIPYEITNYVSLNILSIFLEDMGVKLGMQIDTLALQTLLNGDQADGSDSCAVIGVGTTGQVKYKDLLKPYVRLSRLGKNPNLMVGGEDISVEILDMLATQTNRIFGNQRMEMDVKTPVPGKSDLYVHGKIATNQVLIVDPTSALIKLNAQPLLVETEKIVSNQTNGTFATLTTGFATMMRDARLIIDQSLDFADDNGFPTWMDPTSQEVVDFG